jgi:hypothetical protein
MSQLSTLPPIPESFAADPSQAGSDLPCQCHMKLVAMLGFLLKGVTKLGGSVSKKKRNENRSTFEM